tara:strand:- start:11033 stop:11332 length:300 start_codon:yes stop_codon:yes gene_type:complete
MIMGTAIKRLDGPLKGQIYVERDDLAENLIDVGSAVLAGFDEQNEATAPAVETPGSSKPISRMTIGDLRAELTSRGISIPKGSGKDGAVLKSDLVDALK